MSRRVRPRLAVWKLASCDGCQLTLLDCEDELLTVAGAVEIAYFPEATRRRLAGPYDVSLVEGSVTTAHDAELVQKIRRSSKLLLAVGACATAGGIQALRNFGRISEAVGAVYPRPEAIATLDSSTPVSQHVKVDLELRGCPISKAQLLAALGALLRGARPVLPTHAVCLDCKRKGVPCLMVSAGVPCLGPVTQTGCGALCPSFARGCYGCFGPMESPNASSLAARCAEQGLSPDDVVRLFRTFNAWAPPFRAAALPEAKPHA